MNQLPDQLSTTVVQPAVNDQAHQLITAVNEALAQQATSYRDDSPLPVIGSTPPVAQPGRPPMSQKATDASALMLAAGAAALPIGGMTSLVLYTLGTVDPVTLAIAAGAPAVLVFALARLVKSAGAAVPGEHHHHYTGPVHQQTQTAHHHNRWFGKGTTNL